MNKKLFKRLLTSAVVLSAVAAPAVTFAQDFESMIGETDAVIQHLSAQQELLAAKLNDSYAKISEVHAQAETLQTAIADNEKAIKALEAEIKDLEEAIEKREDLLAEQARAVQANGGAANYVNVVASSKSVTDFVGRVDVVRKMVSANKSLLTQQKEDKEAVEAKKAEVVTAKEDNEKKHVSLEGLKAELETERVANEGYYNALANDLSLAQSARAQLVAQKAEFEYRLQQAAELAAQQAAAEQAAQAQAEAVAAQAVRDEETTKPSETVAQEAPTTEVVETEEVVADALPVAAQPVVEETAAVEATEETAQPAEATVETVVATETEAPVAEAVVSEVVTEEAQPEVTPAETTETEAVVSETAQPVVEEAPVAEAPTEEVKEAEVVAQPAEAVVEAPAASTYGDVLATAAKYVGTPYVWGGKTPSGFDCSGFVQYVFKEAYGIDVGSWTVPQESAGTQISVGQAQAGDLYFWGDRGSTYHVAIATGNGGFIHASQPGTPLGYGNIQHFTPNFAVRVR